MQILIQTSWPRVDLGVSLTGSQAMLMPLVQDPPEYPGVHEGPPGARGRVAGTAKPLRSCSGAVSTTLRSGNRTALAETLKEAVGGLLMRFRASLQGSWVAIGK